MPAPISPAGKVVPVAGDALTVQLRAIPGAANEVMLHITRNGVREEKFTRTELAEVLRAVTALMSHPGAAHIPEVKK